MEFARVFSGLVLEGSELVCESKLSEDEQSAELCFCDGERVYKGLLTLEHKSGAKKLDARQFVQLCMEALRQFDPDRWDYKLHTNPDLLTLTIKQYMETPSGEKAKTPLADIALAAVPDSRAEVLASFHRASGELRLTRAQNAELNHRVFTLQQQVTQLEKTNLELTTWKDQLQNDLMQKFVLVLNNKKAEIRRLRTALREGDRNAIDQNGYESESSQSERYESEQEEDDSVLGRPSGTYSTQDMLSQDTQQFLRLQGTQEVQSSQLQDFLADSDEDVRPQKPELAMRSRAKSKRKRPEPAAPSPIKAKAPAQASASASSSSSSSAYQKSAKRRVDPDLPSIDEDMPHIGSATAGTQMKRTRSSQRGGPKPSVSSSDMIDFLA